MPLGDTKELALAEGMNDLASYGYNTERESAKRKNGR